MILRQTCLILTLGLTVHSGSSAARAAECDVTPPSLSSFSLAPTSVDVSTQSRTVTCSMTAEDVPAGVASATCSLSSPTFLQNTECVADAPSSGTREAGTFTCQAPIPRYAESGLWSVQSVSLIDTVGNAASIPGFQLQLQGFPTTVFVTSQPDFAPPAVTSFDFNPKSINTTSADATFTCSVGVADAPAGVTSVSCLFQNPSQTLSQSCIAEAPSSGTRNAGTFSCTVRVPRYSEPGTWKASVFLEDGPGNLTFLDATLLGAQGFPTNLTVTSNHDALAPSLTNLTLTPASVDPGAGPAVVTCAMTFTDAPAGVNFAGCGLISPSSEQSQGCVAFDPVSGTRTNGTFRCQIVIPIHSEGGTWDAVVQGFDFVGNAAVFDALALGGLGFPNSVDVICEGGSGGDEPSLTFVNETTLTWTAVDGAASYDVYRGGMNELYDLDFDGLADAGYGTCVTSLDPIPTDLFFVDAETPFEGEGFFYLVEAVSGGVPQGLGRSSSGGVREAGVPCP